MRVDRLMPVGIFSSAFLAFYDRALLAPMITRASVDLGVLPDEVAHAITVYVLAYAVAQVPWAAVSGRIGQFRTLAIAGGLSAIGAVLSAVALDPGTLMAGRAISGAALAAIVPTILVHIGDTLPLSLRAGAAVTLATALSLGMTVGTALAAAAADWWSWRVPFVSSAVAGGIICVFFALARRRERPAQRVAFLASFPRLARSPWVHVVLWLGAVEGALLIGVLNFIPVALEVVGVSISVAGLVVAGFGVAVVVSGVLIRTLVTRTPQWVLLGAGGLAMVVGFAALALRINLVTAAVAVILFGFAWACAHTQVQTWATDAMIGARPLGMALFAVALFGGGVLGSTMGTFALAVGDFPRLFAICFVVALVFTVAAVLLRRRYLVQDAD